jgi:hypothetical protein
MIVRDGLKLASCRRCSSCWHRHVAARLSPRAGIACSAVRGCDRDDHASVARCGACSMIWTLPVARLAGASLTEVLRVVAGAERRSDPALARCTARCAATDWSPAGRTWARLGGCPWSIARCSRRGSTNRLDRVGGGASPTPPSLGYVHGGEGAGARRDKGGDVHIAVRCVPPRLLSGYAWR